MMDAEARISKLFWSYTSRFTEIFTFRVFCNESFQFTESFHKEKELSIANAFFYTDLCDRYFTDRDSVLEIIGTPTSMAEKIYEHKFLRVKKTIDAACLVFAHAIIDNLVHELCIISSWILADKWSAKVLKKKITFEDTQQGTLGDIRNNLIDDYINRLEHESLLKKYDILLSVCHPSDDLQLTRGQKLNRDRLSGLDNLRHDAAHGNHVSSFLPCGDDDIKFFRDMCSLLVSNVCDSCNIKINPCYFFT